MKVGWLADDPGYIGGAELTQSEFRMAAPEGIEVISCPAGEVQPGLDRYVVHNCMTYSTADVEAMGDAVRFRYHNDTNFGIGPQTARHIFCSPLQKSRMQMEGECIPPAIDLERFRGQSNGHREGNVCLGRMAYGKGLDLLAEYGEPVDVYSTTYVPTQGNITYKGKVPPRNVPKVLAAYKTFVFLPTALEPFGRAVVEAWAAGLEIITNRLVGARYWIEENPRGLETASKDFWEAVLA